jgi:hypothetical protein
MFQITAKSLPIPIIETCDFLSTFGKDLAMYAHAVFV